MKIKALRMFSHYHLGTFSQGETRTVKKEIGEMLVKMHLAEEVDSGKEKSPDPEHPEKAKTGGKGGNKRGSNGGNKDASEG